MKKDLPAPLLSQLSEFLAARMALYFPRERWRDLVPGEAIKLNAATYILSPEGIAEFLSGRIRKQLS